MQQQQQTIPNMLLMQAPQTGQSPVIPNMPLMQAPQTGQIPVTPQMTVNNPKIIRNLTQFPCEFSYTCAQRASRL